MTDLKSTGDQPIDDMQASVSEVMAGAGAAAEQAHDATRTYRGRTMEELVPRIREELGHDAIVLRSGEVLEGGVGGFFQRRLIEVVARAPLAHELEDAGPRNDRATAEGLSTPAVQALIDQAQPFAAQLAAAQGTAVDRVAGDDPAAEAAAFVAGSLPAGAGLYGPQPNFAFADAADAVLPTVGDPAPAGGEAFVADEAAVASFEAFGPLAASVAGECVGEPDPGTIAEPARAAAGEPTELAEPDVDDFQLPAVAPAAPIAAVEPRSAAPQRPGEVMAVQLRLAESGLPADLAADLVGEALDHFAPFAAGRPLETHVRSVLSRRIAVLADLGPGLRTLAFVGAGGAGKTSAAANLAVAYAAAGRRVTAIVLGEDGDGRGLAARLGPLGIEVHEAGTGEQASAIIARTGPDLAVVDVSDSADPADPHALRSDLGSLDADEVHLTLPATLSAAAAGEAYARLRGLGITHVCLTHADATAHPGAPLGLALERQLPVGYVCTRATTLPAEPAELAARLLP